jgi:hypothetical protein
MLPPNEQMPEKADADDGSGSPAWIRTVLKGHPRAPRYSAKRPAEAPGWCSTMAIGFIAGR